MNLIQLQNNVFVKVKIFLIFIGIFSLQLCGITRLFAGNNLYVLKESTNRLQNPLTGYVYDEKGQALEGVTVTEKGTNKSVQTNSRGYFEIDSPSEAVLLFSYTGFLSVEKKGLETKRVVMNRSEETIEEVVVTTAFGGRQTKESIVGAITTVRPQDLKTSSSNLTTALQGRVAGVIAYQSSGEPGADNADFFIRGASTFNLQQSPLILIDGLELSTRELARLQPNDIEEFSILKDATAAAVYGARGANGVILITTKRGVEGTTVFNVQFDQNVSHATRNLQLADPVRYMELYNQASKERSLFQIGESAGSNMYDYYKIEGTRSGINPHLYPSVDWMDMLLKDYTMNSKANVSLRGGGKVARYFISGSMTTDNGILKVDPLNNFNNNIKLNSYSVRSNIDINLTKTTDLAVRMYGNFDDYNGPILGGSGAYESIMSSNSVRFPAVFIPDEANMNAKYTLFGSFKRGELNQDDGEDALYKNPYAQLVKGYKDYSQSLMLAQVELKHDLSSWLLEGLKFRLMAHTQRDSYFSLERKYNPFYFRIDEGSARNDVYRLEAMNSKSGTSSLDFNGGSPTAASSAYAEIALNYDTKINEKHNVNALLVAIGRTNINAKQGNVLQLSLPHRNVGVSGRASYGYDARYHVEFNFGMNGSERFHKSNRFGFFPSAGASWVISNEKFFEPVKQSIQMLKLRSTYGLIGNDAIGSEVDRFFFLSEVELGNGPSYVFGERFNNSQSGITIKRYANPEITWEISKRFNLGLDTRVFGVGINMDYSTDKRSQILMDRQDIPSTMGLQAGIRSNAGAAESKAFETSVDYSSYFSDSFSITFRGNFTYARNRYLKYEEIDFPKNELYRSRIGQSLSQNWGLIAERLFIDELDISNSPKQYGEYMPGDIKYRDINGDGIINDNDMVPIGHPTSPQISYGFGFSLRYKSLDFSSFFSGLANRSFWIDYNKINPFLNDQRPVLESIENNHWSLENQNLYAFWPRLSLTNIENNSKSSTWFMRDGTMMRLKQLELGYTLNEDVGKRFGIQNMRIFFIGNNLLTFSRFKQWDVELGGNAFNYPIQKVYNLGVNVTF